MARSIFQSLVELQMGALVEYHKGYRRLLNLARIPEAIYRSREGATPCDVVFTKGTLKLLRYRRTTPATYAEPLLICYALVNRPYILDLQPHKSVVRQYLARGFDVYLIDWGAPADADRGRGLNDYVCTALKDVVDFIVSAHGRHDLSLLGYCMGGTMSTMFTAVHAERVKNMTLLAAPIDFGSRQPLLHLWTDARYFDVDALIDAFGNCPGAFLQACFLLMKPVQNLFEKPFTFQEQMHDFRFIQDFFAMERWTNDNIPVAGEAFREFVKKLYQGNELVKGTFCLGDRPIDLGQISCPLLLLTAANDHLVAPSSTEGILRHVASRDVQKMRIDAGHVGLVVSDRAHKTFWPEATRWLAERSTPAAVPNSGPSTAA